MLNKTKQTEQNTFNNGQVARSFLKTFKHDR